MSHIDQMEGCDLKGAFEEPIEVDSNDTTKENSTNGDENKDNGTSHECYDDDEQSKQPRLMRACDNCRRKKVKCDGSKPSCSHCTRMKLACHYSPLVRKKRVRRSIIEKLEERLESMEQMLQPLVERLSPSDPTVAMAGIGATPTATHFTSQQQTYTQQGSVQGFYEPGMPVQSQALNNVAYPASTGPPMPPPHIVEELMKFTVTIETQMDPSISWKKHIELFRKGLLPDFVIYSCIALGARYSSRPEFACTPRYNAGREYAKRAAELVSGLVDKPDPEVIQTLMALSLYEWGCGRGESAWTYTGMATRLAQRCRMHLVDEDEFNEHVDSPKSWAKTEWKRRLWWRVYCGDRISVIFGSRPATVHDDDCVVNLPSHDYEWIMGLLPEDSENNASSDITNGMSQSSSSTKFPDCIWALVELYRVSSRISEFVNRRRRPLRRKDIPRREMFELLDKELEDLRARFLPVVCFPPNAKWSFDSCADFEDGVFGVTSIYSLFFSIHCMYYGTKIILYRSELPYYLHETIEPEQIAYAKSICVDAAHKQAETIKWALDNIPVEHWDPKIGIWSLQGASIHVNAALSEDNNIAEQSRRDLEIHLRLHVASDQYFHFNMAIITMLHHVFNIRKRQRLAATAGDDNITRNEQSIIIEHINDTDPWIVPQCSSFLGFTYSYNKLRGVLNDAIKKTTYSPPEISAVGEDENDPLPILFSQAACIDTGILSPPSTLMPQQPINLLSIPDTQMAQADIPSTSHQNIGYDMGSGIQNGTINVSCGIMDNKVTKTGSNYDYSHKFIFSSSVPTDQSSSISNDRIGCASTDYSLSPGENPWSYKEINSSHSGASQNSLKRSSSTLVSVENSNKNALGLGDSERGRIYSDVGGNTRNRGQDKPENKSSMIAALKPSGAQQLEQLQRLEELRARVLLLQQLSSNNAISPVNAGPTFNQARVAIKDGSSFPKPISNNENSTSTLSVPVGDVNSFLNSFAESIGTMAEQLGTDNTLSDVNDTRIQKSNKSELMNSTMTSTRVTSSPSQPCIVPLDLFSHDNGQLTLGEKWQSELMPAQGGYEMNINNPQRNDDNNSIAGVHLSEHTSVNTVYPGDSGHIDNAELQSMISQLINLPHITTAPTINATSDTELSSILIDNTNLKERH